MDLPIYTFLTFTFRMRARNVTGVPEIIAHLYFVNISLSFDRGEIRLESKDTLLNSL